MHKDFPRYLPYVEMLDEINDYNKAATVEAEVMVAEAFYNQGKQWGLEGETVKLSTGDAKLLERVGHVRVVSSK
jgi:hypothetical protein